MSGFVVWFTGLSGAGKSTLAAMLAAEFRARAVHVELLDGDEVRTHLSKGLSFSKEDRDTNIRRIGFVAKLIARSGGCAMIAAISPYKAVRDEQRAQIPRFVEVYCSCAISVLADRDVKGLYKKAIAGEIKHFTGIDDPYEPPDAPEVVVHTDRESKEESLARIVAKLDELGYVPRRGAATMASAPGAGAQRLIAPHGGELVRRHVVGRAAETLAERAKALPVIDLDARSEGDVELIASGALSPLRGFMGSKDYLRVVREMRLEGGLPWALPITLPASDDQVGALRVGGEAALRARDGRLVAVIEVNDVWRPDRELEATAIFATTAPGHPGVARLRSGFGTYVGGEIQVFEPPGPPAFPAYHLSPADARARFVEKGWRRIAGLHPRHPMDRADEHVAKAALEACDGLLLHPAALPAGPDEIPTAVRLAAYEALIEGYFVRERVVLAVCPAPPRYAGAREALFEAIVRKNYGCTHVIVQREHGAASEQGPVRDPHEIWSRFGPGELGVTPLCFEEPFYSTVVGGMATAKTAPGDVSTRVRLSRADLQAALRRGELLPPEIIRPEVARVLREAMRGPT